MNLLHLKYAIEVAKTASITKAAENLFMGQPNLSRAIKELEESLGFDIFRRTSKGIVPTAQGEEFLEQARSILSQVEAVEKMYRTSKTDTHNFSVSVPRSSYISYAFTRFAENLNRQECSGIYYKETDFTRTLSDVVNADYKLGILRYPAAYDKNLKSMLDEKGLIVELICEFDPMVVVSKDSNLAQKEELKPDDLENQVEIIGAEPYVPSVVDMKKDGHRLKKKEQISVFDRESQFEVLSQLPQTFMLEAPISPDLLQKFGLVQKRYSAGKQRFRDVLIFKKEYRFTPVDIRFLEELTQSKRLFIK